MKVAGKDQFEKEVAVMGYPMEQNRNAEEKGNVVGYFLIANKTTKHSKNRHFYY
jgi:hypothetical protein